MQRLQIGLSSWIIQDGNYPEFHVGKEYDFALEFYPPNGPLLTSDMSSKALTPAGDAFYDAAGTVVFLCDEAWVVDFGVPTYREERPPPSATIGATVNGRVYLGVDPFFYFERLANIRGMPQISHTWLIHGIQLETTPWIESVDDHGRTFRTRDESRKAYRAISATDAWNQDNGSGHYILDCEMRGARVA